MLYSGLESYDPVTRQLKFTTDSQICKFLASFTVGNSAGSRVVEGIEQGTPFAIVTAITPSGTNSFVMPHAPNVTFNQQTKTVSWGDSSGFNSAGSTIIIGIY